MKKSWKTSLGGIGMILTAVTQVIQRFVDTGVIHIGLEEIGMITGGAALLNARDNNVSSEEAGAIKPNKTP